MTADEIKLTRSFRRRSKPCEAAADILLSVGSPTSSILEKIALKLSGESIVGFRSTTNAGASFRATNPRTGESLPPDFFSAGADEKFGAGLAHEAFATYSQISGAKKQSFCVPSPPGLTAPWMNWSSAPSRRPLFRNPACRAKQRAPVASFASSRKWWKRVRGSWRGSTGLMPRVSPRSPICVRCCIRWARCWFWRQQFSSGLFGRGRRHRLCAGRGKSGHRQSHPAHPGTSELVGQLVRESVRECSLPEGVFSFLMDSGTEVGVALVKHPLVKAVGFTGSHKGGRAIMDAAAARPEPIPVFAEMGSTNPVFILPGALRENGANISIRNVQILHAGSRPVLHQARNGVPAGKRRRGKFRRQPEEFGPRIGPIQHADIGHRSAYQSATGRRKTEPE